MEKTVNLRKFEKRPKCDGVDVVGLPPGEVTDTFNATNAPPILTEDLKETLVSLRDRKLGADRDHLGRLLVIKMA